MISKIKAMVLACVLMIGIMHANAMVVHKYRDLPLNKYGLNDVTSISELFVWGNDFWNDKQSGQRFENTFGVARKKER
ncbi:MAG: hypothetical protein LBB21_06640 [Holosporaceae bacterium]|jgi:hypothetical protein|nr:hypothetical protein [Holosporaceae bacterium]